MVKTLNVALDDDDYDAAKEIKDERGLTWEGFVKAATQCLNEE